LLIINVYYYGKLHYTSDSFQANIEHNDNFFFLIVISDCSVVLEHLLIKTYLEAMGTKVQSYPFKTLVTASLISLLSRDCPTDAVVPFGRSLSSVPTPDADVAVLPSFAVLDNISAIVICEIMNEQTHHLS